jgi:hypothetical protein
MAGVRSCGSAPHDQDSGGKAPPQLVGAGSTYALEQVPPPTRTTEVVTDPLFESTVRVEAADFDNISFPKKYIPARIGASQCGVFTATPVGRDQVEVSWSHQEGDSRCRQVLGLVRFMVDTTAAFFSVPAAISGVLGCSSSASAPPPSSVSTALGTRLAVPHSQQLFTSVRGANVVVAVALLDLALLDCGEHLGKPTTPTNDGPQTRPPGGVPLDPAVVRLIDALAKAQAQEDHDQETAAMADCVQATAP